MPTALLTAAERTLSAALIETELFFNSTLCLGIISFVGDGGGDCEGLGVGGTEAGGGKFEAHGMEMSATG